MNRALQISIVRMETNASENYKQVAFADKDGDPDDYVILQRAMEPDEQDEELGIAGCYIEVSNPSICGYDLCDRVTWDGRTVALRFRSDLKIRADDLLLDLGSAEYSASELRDYLAFVANAAFEDRADRPSE